MASCTDENGSSLEAMEPRQPRGYQIIISKKAVEENVIVVLPTGTGKTQIATMVINKLEHQIRLPYDDGGMRSFFLVPYKVLVDQQAEEIVRFSNLEDDDVGKFTGDLNVDSWLKEHWVANFKKYLVFVMTAQIFKDLIDKDYLSLSKVNLVIFDECHHAAMKKKNKETNHVYRLIMKSMRMKDPSLKPKILGLTASVINNKADGARIQSVVKDLENTYSASCISVAPEEVQVFRTNATQVIWQCPMNYGAHKTVPIVSAISYATRVLEPQFKQWKDTNKWRRLPISWSDMKSSLTNISESATEFGTWLAIQACGMYKEELLEQYYSLQDIMPRFAELLLQIANFLGWSINVLKYVIGIHQRFHSEINGAEVTCLRLVSPKMLRLLQILENYRPQLDSDRKLKGIIFVKTRWNAKGLCLWLEQVSKLVPSLNFLKPGYLIGYSNRPGLTSKLVVKSKSQQEDTINRFKCKTDRKDSINILVATSVLEEGLNVTDCNLVIRFHPPSTFKSWLQSSGRARAKGARYVLMTTIGTEYKDLMKNLAEFSATDKLINEYCLKSKEETDGMIGQLTEDEEEEDNKVLHDQTVKSETTSAWIDAGKAISVVNCYCQQLDSYWVPHPIDEPMRSGGKFFHRVKLPMIAAYAKKVDGYNMSNSKNAKMSAYLNLCKRLYEANGLDEYLQPIRKEELIKKELEKLNVEIPREPFDGPNKPGTAKRKQVYRKIMHASLSSKEAGTGAGWYLYRIRVTEDREVFLSHVEDTENYGHAIRKEEKRRCGILCRAKIPLETINSSFPVFRKNYLKMDVTIELVAENIIVGKTEEAQLVEFHKYLFNVVLGFRESRYQYKSNDLFSHCLVVPVDISGNIDYPFVDEVKRKKDEPDGVERKEEGFGISRENYVFRSEDYKDCLVMRWYNHADNQESRTPVEDKDNGHPRTLFNGAFHVLNVLETMNPTSKFPTTKREGKNPERWVPQPKSYQDYYKIKYNIEIKDLNQPLLEVDYVEKLANPHIPIRSEKAKLYRRVQHFVPELCVICPIPVSLWEDAVCLPSIFFRLNQLLNAASFHTILLQEVCIGSRNPFGLGSLKWKSTIAKYTARKMAIPKKFELCRDEAMDTSGDPIDDNFQYCDQPMMDYFDDESDDEDENMMEIDEETGEIFSVNNRDSKSGPATDSNTLGPDFNQTLDINVTSNHLYSDVQIESAIKLSVFGELDIPNLQDNVDRECKECIGKVLGALDGIARDSQNSMFGEDFIGMEGESMISIPLRNLNSFKDMPRLCYKLSSGQLTPDMIMEALTCTSAQDFLDMERYETMGDTFLKFATIEHFHAIAPKLPEGCLTYIKGQLVSNYNLYRLAKKLNLAERMHVQPFHREGHVTWCPPGFETIVQPSNMDDTIDHFVSDKQVADCVESLIGVILTHCGMIDAIKFMSYIGLKVSNHSVDDLNSSNNEHWIRDKLIPYENLEDVPKSKIDDLCSSLTVVEKKLNYEFKDKGWLLMAYTHPSSVGNDITGCYQRLEILGDAVLDFLITFYLFHQKTKDEKSCRERYFDPGELTDLRSALVNNVFFGCVLSKYHLHKSLLASPDLKARINTIAEKFVQECDDTEKTRTFLLRIKGFYVERGADEESRSVEMPKILGDIFEALIGAIYLDSGRNLNTVWEILYSMISEELRSFCLKTPRNPMQLVSLNDTSAKFSLYTFIHGNDKSKETMVHVKLKYLGFDIIDGLGKNKKLARIDAARKAIFMHEKVLQEQG